MRAATAVSVLGVSILIAAPAGAQAPAAMPPMMPPMMPPGTPGAPPPQAEAPALVPPPVAQPEEPVGPAIQEVGQPGIDVAPTEVYGPEPDLTQDEAVAQTYDDGYDPQAAAEFQQALDPYGSWYDDGTYGNVWIPSSSIVGNDFTPYATGGHWVLTEFGWTWVSDWGWGWAPFHYGRWTVIGRRGWCWVPGTIWGPGWVSWRAGGGLVGWAPLPPRGASLPPVAGYRTPWRFTRAEWMGKPVAPASSSSGFVGKPVAPSSSSGFAGKPVAPSGSSSGFAGKPVPAYMSPAAVPGAFLRTRVVTTSAGTSGAWHLAAVAPSAMPHAGIAPRAGVPLAARPWAHSSAGQPMIVGGGRNMPVVRAARRPFAPQSTVGASLRAPRGYGATPGVAPARQYGFAAPARTYAPAARYYAPPARSFAPAARYYAPPARSFAPPARSFAPAPRYYAPPARSFAPAPAFHPAPTFSPPAHFSAPSHFGGSSGFGGGGRSFGGGGGRRR